MLIVVEKHLWKLLVICWILVVRNTWPFKGRVWTDIIDHKAVCCSSCSLWVQDSERHLTAILGCLPLPLEGLCATVVKLANCSLKQTKLVYFSVYFFSKKKTVAWLNFQNASLSPLIWLDKPIGFTKHSIATWWAEGTFLQSSSCFS